MSRWINYKPLLVWLALIVFIIILGSCSPADILDLVKPSGGVDAELVVGDKNQAVNTEIGRQSADTIINEASNWFPWLMVMVALMLPTPTTMWKWFRNRKK